MPDIFQDWDPKFENALQNLPCIFDIVVSQDVCLIFDIQHTSM